MTPLKSLALVIAVVAMTSNLHAQAPNAVHSRNGTSAGAVETHFPQPRGATVLYSQSGPEAASLVVQDFPDMPAVSAQLSDDFVVAAPTGWTVTSLSVQFSTSVTFDFTDLRYSVKFFADAGGRPATQPRCSVQGIVPELDDTHTTTTLVLPEPCHLEAGTWWMSTTPELAFAGFNQLYQSLSESPTQIGSPPHWQNPNGGWGGDCRSWTALIQCPDLYNVILTPTEMVIFQLNGHTGGVPGYIDLTIGLAQANGNPVQCGTATHLSATAGDQINFCYTVTNHSPIALNRQSLTDTVVGDLLTGTPQSIPPGGSYQYNRTITASVSQSPTSTWTASDRLPGYAASTQPYAFVPIHTTGTALNIIHDASVALFMPFSFTFYGKTSNRICINNNGLVFFNRINECDGRFFNYALPNATVDQTEPFLAPFWDDFYAGGNIYYQTLGSAPNRRFVVEYYQRGIFDQTLPPTYHSGPGYTFELIFNEADNSIDFNYDSVSNGGFATANLGAAATIGLQHNKVKADQYSYNTASLSDHQNIHWTVANVIDHSATATVSLDVGAPVIAALPSPLVATAEAGSSTSVPLYIGNLGNRPLIWYQTPPAPASHFPLLEAYILPFHAAAETRVGAAPVAVNGAVPRSLPAIPAVAAVPAYGVAYYDPPHSPAYVSLDAADGSTLSTIATSSRRFFAGAFAQNDFSRQYVVDSPGSNLYSINTSTGVQTLIGASGVPAIETVSGIRWDSSTDSTYLMTTECGTNHHSKLYTLNLASGVASLVGTAGNMCIIDIAITPLGLMYGVDVMNDTLVAINKTNGSAAHLGSLGFNANYAQGMDFDASTGILYLAGYSGHAGAMYTLNLTSGAANLISPLGPNVQMDAFAIARPIPACLRPSGVAWLSQSLLTGVIAPGNSVIDLVTLDASALTPGPYGTTICISSNDVVRSVVAVPVTLTVSPAIEDRFMRSGFDTQN